MQNLEAKLSRSAINNINEWLSKPKYADYKLDLERMIADENWQELEDAFFQVIEFGTAGIRGKTGVGSNRINRVTIGQSAQALCEYASSVNPNASLKGIVIAYDTRLTSDEYSKVAASVVAANGFKTYIFEGFRATPELSFAVRQLGCIAGIVISASHNPPSDNGFKAYWNDGGQLVSPHDKGVIEAASQIADIKKIDFDKAVAEGRIKVIGEEIDQSYVKIASSEALGAYRDINIVYSPLHGTGQRSVLPVLKAVDFDKVSVVESQMVPDGNFGTIPSGKPNPEEKPANDMAVKQMLAENADIAITNDPDADRIGVIVNQLGQPKYLSGNQSAILVADFALKNTKVLGELTRDHYMCKTIVTTDMLDALAKHYGVKIYSNLLIGFKYIAELIRSKEVSNETFLIGCEESFGMLKGSYVRDKDAATGALMITEYAAELKSEGKTLWDKLMELYAQHNLFVERLDTMVCPGASGFEKMKRIMDGIRSQAPSEVGGSDVTAVLDYQSLERLDLITGEKTPIDCKNNGNIIVLEFGDERRRITVRPSGTEPKIKFYIQWVELPSATMQMQDQYDQLDAKLAEMNKELEKILNSF